MKFRNDLAIGGNISAQTNVTPQTQVSEPPWLPPYICTLSISLSAVHVLLTWYLGSRLPVGELNNGMLYSADSIAL